MSYEDLTKRVLNIPYSNKHKSEVFNLLVTYFRQTTTIFEMIVVLSEKYMHNKQYVIDCLTFLEQFTQTAKTHSQINLNILLDGAERKFDEMRNKVVGINKDFSLNLKFLSYTQGTSSNSDLDQLAQRIVQKHQPRVQPAAQPGSGLFSQAHYLRSKDT